MKPLLRDNRTWLILFIAALAILSSTRWRFPRQSGGFTPVARRLAAPDLVLTQPACGAWRLADHRGQVVLINYWATWCEPCREELPGLTQLSRSFAASDFAIVGVSLDDGPNVPARVEQFAQQFRIPYPIAFPPPEITHSPRDVAIPTTVLIDRHGRIAKTYTGAVEQRDFTADIATLLAES